jgi:hypothetical protein
MGTLSRLVKVPETDLGTSNLTLYPFLKKGSREMSSTTKHF